MSSVCCQFIAKYLLCIITFIFFVLGSLMLSVGIWLIVDRSSFVALLKLVENDNYECVFGHPKAMISALELIGEELTIFSFLRIVLMPSPNIGYRTAIVFSDPAASYTDRLIAIINSEARIPAKICTFHGGAVLKPAPQYEGPTNLNVFVFHRVSDLNQMQLIQHSLFHTEHRLLLILSSVETDQELLDNIRQHTLGIKSILIFRPNCELWFYRIIQSEQITRYQLDLTNRASVREIIQSVHNWRNLDMPSWSPIIFVHYHPPFNMVVPNYNANGKYIGAELMGPDPLMAYDIASQLNATARIVTDLETVAIGYDKFFGENALRSSFSDYLYIVKYFDRVSLNRRPLDYNWTSPIADFYITSTTMRVPSPSDAPTEPVDCYPHSFDCLSIVVPRSKQNEWFLKRIVRHQFSWAVLMTLLAFVVARFCITGERWSRATMVTVGLFLVQNFENIRMKPSEHLWTVFMMVFGFFSTTILSSMLFASLVDNRVVAEIDTLEQLAESGLTVYVCDPTHEDTWDFSNTSIASQVKYVASVDIDMALLALANTSNAYVLKSSRAQWSLSIVDYVTRNEGSLFRIMKDRLICSLIAYKLPSDSHFRAPVDFIVQSLQEAGIFAVRYKWSFDMLVAMFPAAFHREPKQFVVLTLDVLLGVFYLYMIGVVLSSCAFGAEIICGCCTNRKIK